MRSLGYWMVETVLRISKTKNFLELDPDEMKIALKKERIKQNHKPPKKMQNNYRIEEERIGSNSCYIVSPRENQKKQEKQEKQVLLFIHGGAYVKEMNPFYWDVISKLAKDFLFYK